MLVLLPLNGRHGIAWVQGVEGALLEDGLQSHVNLGTLHVLHDHAHAQILNDVCIEHANRNVVDPESLRIAQKRGFKALRENGLRRVPRLRQRINVVYFASRGDDD